MPFVSQAQRSACYAQAAKAKKEGRKSKWNCKKYEKHSKKRKIKSRIKLKSKKSNRKQQRKRSK